MCPGEAIIGAQLERLLSTDVFGSAGV